jgi:hypothetical protein
MPKERGIAMKGITLQEMSDETVQQLHANYVRQPAFAHTDGTAKAYTVTLDPKPTSLEDGFGITIVPHIVNEAEVTLNINELGALSLKDQKGKPFAAGKLQVGKPYTFRKVGTDFLADSGWGGGGNAQPQHVLELYKFTNDEGEQIGQMINRRAENIVISGGIEKPIPEGYYDGTGLVILSPMAGSHEVLSTKSSERESIELAKLKAIKIARSGTYRVSFSLKMGKEKTHWVGATIYKNGVAYGTQRSTNSETYVIFTQDLYFDKGDSCEVWGRGGGYTSATVGILKLSIALELPTFGTVTLD